MVFDAATKAYQHMEEASLHLPEDHLDARDRRQGERGRLADAGDLASAEPPAAFQGPPAVPLNGPCPRGRRTCVRGPCSSDCAIPRRTRAGEHPTISRRWRPRSSHHLRRMLNSRQGHALVALDYGMPDLSEALRTYPSSISMVEQAVRASIERVRAAAARCLRPVRRVR